MNRVELLEKVKNELPLLSGVYIIKNADDEVIYVGKAKALKRRVKSYFDNTPKTQKTYSLVENIDHFEYILTNSELDAFSLESNLIKKYKPKYNILLKDDKSFPYLKIDFNEKYPRVQIARRPKQQKNVMLFGPYVTGTKISEFLSLIKSAFPIRWCNLNFDKSKMLKKPCLHGEIGDCVAPCISQENEQKYMQIIDQVVWFLNGKTSEIKRILKQKMEKYASEMKFEDALIVRDQLRAVENMDKDLLTNLSNESNIDVFAISELDETFDVNLMMIRNGKNVGQINYPIVNAVGEKNELLMSFLSNFYEQSQVFPKEIVVKDLTDEQIEMLKIFYLSHYSKTIQITKPKIGTKLQFLQNCERNAMQYLTNSKDRLDKHFMMTVDALSKLKDLLNLKKLSRIEGFDISNISGAYSVASMVVFENGEPAYKEYRKFKIKTVEGANDFASMKEILTRRLTDLKTCKDGFEKRPDLILVDGGFGQLSYAKQALDETEMNIPIISLAEANEEICTLFSDKPIVLSKRDYMLKLLQRVRDESHRFAITFHRELRSKQIKSELDNIEGLGKAKIASLLKKFKSSKAVAVASKNDLMKTDGIGENLATIIYDYFHKDIIK